jgi:hypothetical protein
MDTHSQTDNSTRNDEEDRDYPESFVDPDNESRNGRCSVKTASHSLLSMLATQAPY